MRLGELAASMRWSLSRLSHHVSRMQQRGLVAREECADDGRSATVVLTDAGWAAIREAAIHHVESVRRHLVDLLDADEIAALTRISEKVVGHLDARLDARPRRP
jgi:DNA-binding MarR family transcriptional regulator